MPHPIPATSQVPNLIFYIKPRSRKGPWGWFIKCSSRGTSSLDVWTSEGSAPITSHRKGRIDRTAAAHILIQIRETGEAGRVAGPEWL